jgi:hypothetical protein
MHELNQILLFMLILLVRFISAALLFGCVLVFASHFAV